MTAALQSLAAQAEPARPRPGPRARLNLAHLIESAAQAFPNRPAFVDAANRSDLTSTEVQSMSLGEVRREIERISGLFVQFRLQPGAVVAIQMPNVPEAALAFISVLRAGLCPLMVPVALDMSTTARIIEDAGAEAAITITQAGPLKPAQMMCEIAARYFGLRFLTAFGKDVPDGMIGLDRLPWSLSEAAPRLGLDDATASRSMVATTDEASGQSYGRTCESLIATGLGIVAATRMKAGHRILSMVAPDDLAGLACGIVPGLAAGVPLTMMSLFDAAALRIDLGKGQPVHLVAPAWMESALAASGLTGHRNLASLILIHKLPFVSHDAANDRGDGEDDVLKPIIDVLAVGEQALFIVPRGTNSAPVLPIEAVAPRLSSGHALVEARNVDGILELKGRATRCLALHRATRNDIEALADDAGEVWMPSAFTARTDGAFFAEIDRLQRG